MVRKLVEIGTGVLLTLGLIKGLMLAASVDDEQVRSTFIHCLERR